jgi:hypothetical protein
MTRKQRKEIQTRIHSFELRLHALRSIPGPIDPRDAKAEKYLQSEVNKMRSQLEVKA